MTNIMNLFGLKSGVFEKMGSERDIIPNYRSLAHEAEILRFGKRLINKGGRPRNLPVVDWFANQKNIASE